MLSGETVSPKVALVHRALVAAALVGFSGCATTGGGGATQVVSVSARTATGEAVTGLECVLRNDKGEWRLTSPGSAEVQRSEQPFLVGCASEQWQPAPADPGATCSDAAPVKSMAIGAATAGTVAAATTIGATGYAAMAAVPLFAIGALVGAAMGWGHSTTDAAHAYPPSIVVLVEPRSPAPK
jgi:hypothetical protein